MSRSYSKIRHIQEANIRLEKRMLSEQIQDPNITQLVSKLKEIPLYQEPENLRIDNNRVYYTGNIKSSTVLDKHGKVDEKRSQVGTFVRASDPNARFFEWSGTGWKRGEQQNQYYDQTPLDLASATTDFGRLSVSPQQNTNIAKNK